MLQMNKNGEEIEREREFYNWMDGKERRRKLCGFK